MNLIHDVIADMTSAFSSPRFATLAGQSTDEIAAAIEKLAQDLHKPTAEANPPDNPDRG